MRSADRDWVHRLIEQLIFDHAQSEAWKKIVNKEYANRNIEKLIQEIECLKSARDRRGDNPTIPPASHSAILSEHGFESRDWQLYDSLKRNITLIIKTCVSEGNRSFELPDTSEIPEILKDELTSLGYVVSITNEPFDQHVTISW